MGKLLSVNDIASVMDLAQERVEVPEWGGDLILRALSARDREWFESQMLTEETVAGPDGRPKTVQKMNFIDGRAKMLSRAIVDEEGHAIFDESQVKILGDKSNAVVNRLFSRVQELSGMQPRAVEDAEKNSDAAPSGDSSSGLH